MNANDTLMNANDTPLAGVFESRKCEITASSYNLSPLLVFGVKAHTLREVQTNNRIARVRI